ncbi:MAG: hypothetical protein J6B94_11085 [Lachnospiraceae bacterium]|nr:hypothetical protein [Lachnospiraceae bacterium]
MKRVSKGKFGYTVSHRKWQIMKMLLYIALALGIFLAGYLTTKTTKNILSIVALVGSLPISKEMVGVIMSYRRKPMEKKLYEEISAKAGNLEQIYELLFTTNEKSYGVEAAIIEGKDVICYAVDPKCEVNVLQKHLLKMLDANGYKENVKVFTDYKKFMDRVGDLARREKEEIPYTQNPTYPDLNRDQLIKHLLLALSI